MSRKKKLKKYDIFVKVEDYSGWYRSGFVWRKFRTVKAFNKKEALEKAYDMISDLSRPIRIYGVKAKLVKEK